MPQEPIWTRPETAGVGRPPERSRAEITAAAIDVADAEGLAAVTMRRVAKELGTGAASLYRYVATRDELVDLMIDTVFGEHELVVASGDWRADLLEDLRLGLDDVVRHPWLAEAVNHRPALGPNAVRLTEHSLALLAEHPASGADKMEAIGVLNGMIWTFISHTRLAEDWTNATVSFLVKAATGGEHPHLAAAMSGPPGPQETADAMLVRVLGKVIDGLLPE